MNNLTQRIITGSLFVAALVFCILWSTPSAAILFGIFMILGTLELNKLTLIQEVAKSKGWWSVFIVSIAYIVTFLSFRDKVEHSSILVLIPVLVSCFIYEMFTTRNNSFPIVSSTLFALLYVFIPFISLTIIGFEGLFTNKLGIENGKYILLGFFIILWTSDSMAYVTGKLIGKNKIAPAISPGKTWEGVIGGLVFSLLAGFLISFFTESSLNLWLGMASIISIFGFLGDLSESMLKRKAGVKDSGSLLPGHGGVLDRFDGIVFSAPIVICYLFWI